MEKLYRHEPQDLDFEIRRIYLNKIDKNPDITAGTNTKITYDAKGLITSGSSATLASSDFANQGTTTTVLHGNASGNPAFGAVVEADITLANNSANDVSVTKHGFCPIAPNNTTQFLRADGSWGTPAGTGMTTPSGTGYVHISAGVEDAASATGYIFIGRQILTAASGTYTKTTGATGAIVEVQGGGGGGGGAAGVAAQTGAGAGGGAGAYARLWIPSLSASYTYAVGQAAGGGTAGANPGTAGNNSTFGSGPLITCNGGGAGTGSLAGIALGISAIPGAGGTATGGDINIPGSAGLVGLTFSGVQNLSGSGGNSILGMGGKAAYQTAGGNAGSGYGSGGGGGATSSAANAGGGAGAAGIIIIWEYK